jgi:hypothetical protein
MLVPRVSEAIVQGVDTKTRTLTVKWLTFNATQTHVVLLNDANSYSVPSVGDVGLILSMGVKHYYLGKLEYNYKEKIEGMTTESGETVRMRDVDNNEIYAREIKEGETFLSNMAKGIGMMFSKGGNFSLANRDNDGFSYYVSNRLTKMSGMLLQFFAGRSSIFFGRVMRNIGGKNVNMPSDLGPTIPALEFFVDILLMGLRMGRIHLGYVLDKMGLPEFGTVIPAARLRAIIEVCNALGVSIAALKMDELGNVEITADPAIGKVMIKGGAAQGVLLGGDTSTATHPAAFGDVVMVYLLGHQHPTAMGPSGVPIVPPDLTMISTNVFLG